MNGQLGGSVGLETFLDRTLPEPNHQHEVSALQLAGEISKQLSDYGLFSDEDPMATRVPQITLFTYFCAPKGASEEGLLAAAEFLYVFFLLNDRWDTASAQRQFVAQWSEQIAERYRDRDPTRFLASFRAYQDALVRERQWGTDAFPATLANYSNRKDGRYQWVATDPYTELWELTMGLDLPDACRSWSDPLKHAAVEMTYIANDIGSLARDPPTKNYVGLRMTRGDGLVGALDAAAAEYEHRKALFEQAWRVANTRSPDGNRYVSLLADLTNGNLGATIELTRSPAAVRYDPGHDKARQALTKLPMVPREP